MIVNIDQVKEKAEFYQQANDPIARDLQWLADMHINPPREPVLRQLVEVLGRLIHHNDPELKRFGIGFSIVAMFEPAVQQALWDNINDPFKDMKL